MNRRTFQRYLRKNPELQKWWMENQEWVKANPQMVKEILDQFSAVQAKQSALQQTKKTSTPRPPSRPRFPFPKLNLETLSNATNQLSKTMSMIENIQTIMQVMKPR